MVKVGGQGQARPRKTAEKPPIPLNIGVSPEHSGLLVPFEFVGPIIESRVGQMRAEMEKSFNERLAKIDDLPTKWQLIAGAASGVVLTLGSLFGLLSYFGDRQDNAVDRSATISQSLTRIEGRLDSQPALDTKIDATNSKK